MPEENAENEYQLGDIVQIKSGGPKMTVTELNVYMGSGHHVRTIRCQWFAGSKHESALFPAQALMTPTPS